MGLTNKKNSPWVGQAVWACDQERLTEGFTGFILKLKNAGQNRPAPG
jgi:hypothetical protein